jgi:hypothetical protein
MIVVDMHSHAFPDELAPKAIEALEAKADWKAFGTGTIDDRLSSMDDAGIDVAVICTIATRAELTEGILRWCCSIRSERIIPFASIHPGSPDAADWIRRIVDEGIPGIKMHSVYQDYCVDDPILDGIYQAASETGLIITPHCGRDTAAPDDVNRASPDRIARVIEKFPDLKLVCTHLGGWRMWDESEQYLIGKKDVPLETSFTLHDLDPQRETELFRMHGIDKILFGTDWPWSNPLEERRKLEQLDLTDGELEMILGANAVRVLGL